MELQNLKTLHDEYLARIHEPPRKTAGGLYIVRAEYEKTFCAIIEVLPESNPLSLSIGDVVIFDNYSGRPFPSKDDKLILLKPDDIAGILEDTDD